MDRVVVEHDDAGARPPIRGGHLLGRSRQLRHLAPEELDAGGTVAEHANLRAALGWAQERGESVLGLRLAGALWRFWANHGHLSEGRRWLEGLLAQAGSDLPAAAATVRAKALHGAALVAWTQGDYGQAVALGDESLRLYREAGGRAGIASSLNVLGLVAYSQGDYGRARAQYEESLALFRESGDKWGILGHTEAGAQ
jgi:tetratricopeptide (TPR) repeat protein